MSSRSPTKWRGITVANEVAYHKTVNGALSTVLIPAAQNAEIKALLDKVLAEPGVQG